MKNTEFTSWLAGFLLITRPCDLTEKHRRMIKAHAQLCEYAEKGRLTVTNFMILHDLHKLSLTELRSHVLLQYRSLPSASSEEICYFIQGSFELADQDLPWTHEDAVILCDEIDRNTFGLEPRLIQLYYDLQIFLRSKDMFYDTREVRQELHSIFEHIIDAGYGELDPSLAKSLHDGDFVDNS